MSSMSSSLTPLTLQCQVTADIYSKELSREERVLKKQKLNGPSKGNQPQHALFRKRAQELETAKKRNQ
jgi:hypothetical protein